MAAQDAEASAAAKLTAAERLSVENERQASDNARRAEEPDDLVPKARTHAARIKADADKEADAKRRAAEAEAKSTKMTAEIEATVEADEILAQARSRAHIMRLDTEEMYEQAKAEVATYLASGKVVKAVEDASPTLWMKYLRAHPKVEDHFKKWARDVHRIDDVYALDPRTPLGKPDAKRRAEIRASVNAQASTSKPRIGLERG